MCLPRRGDAKDIGPLQLLGIGLTDIATRTNGRSSANAASTKTAPERRRVEPAGPGVGGTTSAPGAAPHHRVPPAERPETERRLLKPLPRTRFDTDYVAVREVHRNIPWVEYDGELPLPPAVGRGRGIRRAGELASRLIIEVAVFGGVAKLAASRFTFHSNGPGQGLVEVVQVEDQPPFGGRIDPQV